MAQATIDKKSKPPVKWWKRLLRYLLIAFSGFFVLLAILILLIRTPAGQQWITDQLTSYVTKQTGTHCSVDRFYLSFKGNLIMEGLYLEDQNADTLIYAGTLEAGVAVRPLFNREIRLRKINLDQWHIYVDRTTEGVFNFDFLLNTLLSDDDESDLKAPEESEHWNISLSPIVLSNIHLRLDDQYSGLLIHSDLDYFELSLSPFLAVDLPEKITNFYIDGLKLKMVFNEGSESYQQMLHDSPPEEEREDFKLPKIDLRKLSLNSLDIFFENNINEEDIRLKLDVLNLHDFLLIPKTEKNLVNRLSLDQLISEGLVLNYHFKEGTDANLPVDELTSEMTDFEWPGWEISTGITLLTDYSITFSSREKKGVQPKEFDPENIHLKIDSLYIPGIAFSDKTAQAEIRQLILSDHSGLELTHTGVVFNLNDEKIGFSDINANTGKSILRGEFELRYSDFNQFLQNPEASNIFAKIDQLSLSPDELLIFQKDLRENPYFRELIPYPIQFSTTLEGDVKKLQIKEFKGSALRHTRINLNGELTDLLEESGPGFNFPFVNIYSIETDLIPFVELPENYRLPERFWLSGSLSGNTDNITTDLRATLPDGNVNLSGQIKEISTMPTYQIDLIIDHLNTALYTDSIGPEMISGSIRLNGVGFDPYTAELSLIALLDSLNYQGKKLAPLSLTASLSGGVIQLDGSLESTDLKLEIIGSGKLDSISYETEFTAHINELDLKKWEITPDSIFADARFFLYAKGSEDGTTARLVLDTLFLQGTKESYLLDNLTADLDFSSKHTTVDIDSRLLKMNLKANSSPDLIFSGINNYILTYWSSEVPDSVLIDDLEVFMDMRIAESEMLMEVLVPGLTALEETSLELQFIQKQNSLTGMWLAPYIVYDGIEIVDAYAGLSSDRDELDWEIGFQGINFGQYGLPQGRISGIFISEELNMEVDIISDERDQLVLLGLEILNIDDKFIISLDPDRLVFNTYPWTINPNNMLEIGTEFLAIENFKLERGNHSFSMESHSGNRNDFLQINFEQIDIEGLLQLISPDQAPVAGQLSGQLVLDALFESPTMYANIEILDLTAMDRIFGNLDFQLTNPEKDSYHFNAGLKGDEIEILTYGAVNIDEEEGIKFKTSLDLVEMKFDLIEWLVEGEIYNSRGYLSGNLELEGSPEEIDWSGILQFNEVSFVTRETRSTFSIPNEEISFSQSDINFSDFNIFDQDNNPTIINGSVDITELTMPVFDLNIVSRDFKFLESTREDNDFVFGRAILDLNIDLKGDLSTPLIEADVFLKRGSQITLIVPETQVDIIEREGVVIIERRVDGKVVEDDREPEELIAPLFVGVDLNSVIRVHPDALLRIVIDERAGDMLEVAGEANLSFSVDPQGRMSLSGIYELNRGFYEMRMYDIVRRRFELTRGSRLVWSGDPMEADMQISAVYRVRTSPLDLMTSQLAGADQSLRNQYRQELPFDVIMRLEGMIMQPDLSFQLDMPETSRSALGGNVYRRIGQLNQSESELNTQVFSLLVLGRFLSEGLMAEEPRGIQPEAMARSSASRLLTSQLNALSDRYVRGIDLDFDLESFTDYRSGMPEDRTQLSLRMQRSLLDDRLTVQISGQVDLEGSELEEGRGGTDLLGDVSIDYRLTDDGRWGLRGFRKNQYVGLIEGQVVVTGVSLLFKRDFNSFAELFSRKKE